MSVAEVTRLPGETSRKSGDFRYPRRPTALTRRDLEAAPILPGLAPLAFPGDERRKNLMGSFQKLASLVLALLLLPGCGTDLPIYPVQGKIVLTDGDLKQLADAHVEFELEGSPTVRGSGLIASDGRFEVQMLHKGQVVQGLPAGKYRARLLFEDEGKEAR